MDHIFEYVQIAAVAIVLLVIITKAVSLKRTAGINAIAVGRGKKGWGLIFELSAFAGLAVWIVETLLSALRTGVHIIRIPPDVYLFDSYAAKTAGTILIVLGLSVFIWAFVSFGRSWRVGMDRTTPGELVTTGIFAFSRNPIYLFIDLWFAGSCLITGRLSFLLFAVVALVFIHIQILREEKFLAQLYPDQYGAYLARTGRYI